MKLSGHGAELSQVSVEDISHENNTQGRTLEDDIPLGKRAYSGVANEFWHLSHVSFPETREFDKADGEHKPGEKKYLYSSDDSWGSGQTIYIMESLPYDDVFVRSLSLFTNPAPRTVVTTVDARLTSLWSRIPLCQTTDDIVRSHINSTVKE